MLLDHFKDEATDRRSVHGFSGSLILLADGDITRQNIIDFFNLDNVDEIQLDELIANYNGEPNAVKKLAYIYKTENVLINYEAGLLTESQVKTFLGLS